jgi:hypothetical protein
LPEALSAPTARDIEAIEGRLEGLLREEAAWLRGIAALARDVADTSYTDEVGTIDASVYEVDGDLLRQSSAQLGAYDLWRHANDMSDARRIGLLAEVPLEALIDGLGRLVERCPTGELSPLVAERLGSAARAVRIRLDPRPEQKGGRAVSDESQMAVLTFSYTSHGGLRERRRARPLRVWHGETPWHEGAHWYLSAHDLDKNATRDFLLAGMSDTREEGV